MIEEGNNVPIGIAVSMLLYTVYTCIIDRLPHMYGTDNLTMLIIYFVPLIILYVETPVILRKYDKWQRCSK